MDTLQHVPLTPEQKSFCLDRICESSLILKKWSVYYGPKKAKKFRELLFKGHDFSQIIPPTQMGFFLLEIEKVLDIRTKTYDNLGDRTIEMAILAGYAKLAGKHSGRWASYKLRHGVLSSVDYFQEACLAIINAIYGYSKRDIKFSTYIWRCLKNHLSQISNNAEAFCPLTNEDRKLLTEFEKKKASFNGPVTFDEVAQALGLDDYQYSVVNKMLTKVYTESQIPDDGDSHTLHQIKTKNDYTAMRKANIRAIDFQNFNLDEMFEKANLNEMEQVVIKTSVEESSWGWQAELARQYGYSRVRIGQILKKAQEKLRRAYKVAA